jgi:hypothetical protein
MKPANQHIHAQRMAWCVMVTPDHDQATREDELVAGGSAQSIMHSGIQAVALMARGPILAACGVFTVTSISFLCERAEIAKSLF